MSLQCGRARCVPVVLGAMPPAHLDRLSSIDASFLHQEGPASHMHIGGALIFDGPPPSFEDFLDHVRGRLHLVPRYRQKLAYPPLESGRPLWVDDPTFNLEYHVRNTALPAPGSEEQLWRLAARIGFGCLSLGGGGTVVVGLFPENTVQLLHAVGAMFAIGVGTAGIWILGFGVAGSLNSPLARAMRIFPPLALAASILFAVHADGFIGHGAMERLAAYPETIWLIGFGLYIARTHSRRARAAPVPG